MIVDFHTHAFPDELAKRAVSGLASEAYRLLAPVSDGTVAGLIKNMDDWGIGVSVVQPVVTKQSQTQNTNLWAASVASDRLVCFGGVFPHTDDYKRDIDFVVSLGLKGLKFHAEYQDFIIDEPNMLKVYDYALSKGLIILHHAGFDVAFRPPYKSSPKRFLNIINAMKGGVIIASHLGGCTQWGDVEHFLAGTDIYLDTSMGLEFYSEEQFLRILEKHGADKMLFASDSPWSHAGNEIKHLNALPIPKADKIAILGGNAQRILNDA